MNVKELYRQVNIDSVNRYKHSVSEKAFIKALSTLQLKGLIIKIGDEVFINNTT